MNRSIVLAMLLIAACSSEAEKARKAAIPEEKKAWADLVSTRQDVLKLEHACDAEREAYTKARDAKSELLRAAYDSPAYRQMDGEAQKAEAFANACQRRQPDFVEDGHDKLMMGFPNRNTQKARYERIQNALDAWLDACVKCANGAQCVERMRLAERKPLEKWQVERPVCSPAKSGS